MRSRPPQIGRPILHEPHQATAFVPIPDRSKSPASGSRKKGIDSSRPVTEGRHTSRRRHLKMRSRPPQIGRPILHEPHQATAFVPIPDRSKSPASGSRKKGIDSSRPVTEEASYAIKKAYEYSHHRFAGTSRHSLRDWFERLIPRSSRRSGFLSPSPLRSVSFLRA